MKRIRCYGRTKTACIDTEANKLFSGDQNDFMWNHDDLLWNTSSGSEKDFVPRKEIKKAHHVKKKAESSRFFSSTTESPDFKFVADTDKNKENRVPAKRNLKSKKVKGKKTVKKKLNPSENVNIPRFSIIDEYELQVEGKTVKNKRKDISPDLNPSKHSCLASDVESQPANNELQSSLKQLRLNVDESCEKVRDNSGLTERTLPGTSRIINRSNALKDSVKFNSASVEKVVDNSGLREPYALRTSGRKNRTNVHKGSVNYNSARVEKVRDNSGLKELSIPHSSDRGNQSNVRKDSMNCDSVGVEKVIHNSGLTELSVPRRSDRRNRSNILKASVNSNFVSVEKIVDNSGLTELSVSHTSDRRNLSNVLKACVNSNSVSVEKIVDNTGSTELYAPFISDRRNQSNVLKDLVNSNSVSVAEVPCSNENEAGTLYANEDLEEQHLSKVNTEKQSSIHQNQINPSVLDSTVGLVVLKDKAVASDKKNKCSDFVLSPAPFLSPKKFKDIDGGLSAPSSPNISCIRKSSLSQSKRLEISNLSLFSKNLKIVTSTPTVSSRTQFPPKISMFNLSQICAFEKDWSLSKKTHSLLSKSSISFQSKMCNRYPSVSFVQNKSRSVDIRRDSSMRSHKSRRFSSSAQIQQASKSNKSYSCIEKILSESSLKSYIDINESRSIVEKLIQLCGQEAIKPFANAFDWSLITIRKVGEGTYGEVFMLSLKKKSSVIKIIPVSQDLTNTWLNIETVYSEVKVCQCLSELRNNKYNKTSNFNKLNSIHFVKGSYPSKLLAAWDTFSTVKTTYNVRPNCFNEEQLYVILEMEYGGADMDSFVMKNAVEAESILKQVTLSLAIAEETHLFEHRDLHLGNILVQRVKKKTVSYVLRGKSVSIPSHGVMVTIIDFTLSRIFDSGCVYYNDLADDKSLFNQSGDYQFEIYRATRDHLNNQWQEGSLYSNVLWLTFLCVKMSQYRYSRPTSAMHLKCLNSIAAFQSDLKLCKSAFDCLKTCKILSSIPKNDHSLESKLKGKTVFVDRKSFQKSKLSIRN